MFIHTCVAESQEAPDPDPTKVRTMGSIGMMAASRIARASRVVVSRAPISQGVWAFILHAYTWTFVDATARPLSTSFPSPRDQNRDKLYSSSAVFFSTILYELVLCTYRTAIKRSPIGL